MLETLLNQACEWVGGLPLECLQYRFMQEAFLGMLLCAPLTAGAGVHVVNFRMAFFADAIGHSAFAGAALGVLCGAAGPLWMMPLVALLIGLGVMLLKRRSELASDTVIGVFFSFVVAFGLLLASRNPHLARASQMFLYGDILTLSGTEIGIFAVLAVLYPLFECVGFNRLIAIGVHEPLARSHRIHTALYEYIHVALLSLIVIFSVKAAGVLLVGAMLIVPAAAARNLARSAGGMFRLALLIGLVSGIAGLLISAQSWANTAAGATVVMTACVIFLLSLGCRAVRRHMLRG